MFKELFTEKTRLMQKFDSKELDLRSFDIPDKKGKDYQYDNAKEILTFLGFSEVPRAIYKKFKKLVFDIEYGLSKVEMQDLIRGDRSTLERYFSSYDAEQTFIDENLKIATGESAGTWRALKVLSAEPAIVVERNNFYKDENNLKKLKKQLQKIIPLFKASREFETRQRQKATAILGISWDDLSNGFKYIDYFRSGSKRTVPTSLFPFLKAITLKSIYAKKLPKTVYRGLFIDGDKVDDKQVYESGEKIKLKNRKATSWSTSKGMAITFSEAQDFIKDRKNGYQIVVKYDIQSIDDVIADFRVFPNMSFYNQQEILISPKVKIGEIVYVKKGNDYKTSIIKNFSDEKKYGDSAYGMQLATYISNPNSLASSNLDLNDKMLVKTINNLTTQEVIDKYPKTSYNLSIGCLGKTIAQLGIASLNAVEDIKSCTRDSFKFDFSMGVPPRIIEELDKDLYDMWDPLFAVRAVGSLTIKNPGYSARYIYDIDTFEIIKTPYTTPEIEARFDEIRNFLLSRKDLNDVFLPNIPSKRTSFNLPK